MAATAADGSSTHGPTPRSSTTSPRTVAARPGSWRSRAGSRRHRSSSRLGCPSWRSAASRAGIRRSRSRASACWCARAESGFASAGEGQRCQWRPAGANPTASDVVLDWVVATCATGGSVRHALRLRGPRLSQDEATVRVGPYRPTGGPGRERSGVRRGDDDRADATGVRDLGRLVADGDRDGHAGATEPGRDADQAGSRRRGRPPPRPDCRCGP